MKKIIAMLLILVMVFSFAACGTKTDNTDADKDNSTNAADTTDNSAKTDDKADTSDKTDDTKADVPDDTSAEVKDTSAASGMGFYDKTYDYSQNKDIMIAYMTMTSGALYEAFNQAYERWAKDRLLCDYTYYDANSDQDAYLTAMETLAGQGCDGFIVDSGAEIVERVGEFSDELGVQWMPSMTSPTGSDGKFMHPYVGFSGYQFGVSMAEYVVDYAQKNWADFNFDEAAMLSLNFSVSTEINARTTGAFDTWNELNPGHEDDFYELDSVTEGGMTVDAGYNLVASCMAAHGEYKYWLICTAIDDLAEGAARAAETYNVAESSVVTTCGGNALIANWDSGLQSCWVSAFYCDQSCYAEPIINGLYAMIMGWATPENMWYDWVNHGAGETYPQVLLKAFPLEHDTYQDYLEFTDSYSGWDVHNYGEWSGTPYAIIDDIPASYAG